MHIKAGRMVSFLWLREHTNLDKIQDSDGVWFEQTNNHGNA